MIKNQMLEWHQFNYQKHNSFKLDIKCLSMCGIRNFKDLYGVTDLKFQSPSVWLHVALKFQSPFVWLHEPWNFKALQCGCMHEPWNFKALCHGCMGLEISKPFGVTACMSLEISMSFNVTAWALKFQSPLPWLHEPWNFKDLWRDCMHEPWNFNDLWCDCMSLEISKTISV